MELRQLESYIMVVETGSFTKAAELLSISQPTISTHIQMLEMELQTTLLNRHTKSIEVTERGKELYECASDMLGMRDRLLQNWSDESEHTIYLGCSTIPSTYVLPEILPKYKEKYKDVKFVIYQGDSQNIIDGISNGTYQIGFVGMQCEADGIICTPFYKDRIVLVTPNKAEYLEWKKQYEQNQSLDIITSILKTSPIIVRERGSGSQKYANGVLGEMGLKETDLNICARLNDSESIKNMVVSGFGAAMISEKAVEEYCQDGKLLKFEIPLEKANRSLNILLRDKERYRAQGLQFIDFIKNFYKD